MCTGAEIPLIAAGAQAVGSISQGVSQGRQANYQAAIMEQQAQREREIGAMQAEDFRRQSSAQQAAGRAARAGSGVAMAGSPLLVDDVITDEIELGAARIMAGGDARAIRAEQEARLTRVAGSSARTAGYVKAGATLLKPGYDYGKEENWWGAS